MRCNRHHVMPRAITLTSDSDNYNNKNILTFLSFFLLNAALFRQLLVPGYLSALMLLVGSQGNLRFHEQTSVVFRGWSVLCLLMTSSNLLLEVVRPSVVSAAWCGRCVCLCVDYLRKLTLLSSHPAKPWYTDISVFKNNNSNKTWL